MISTVADDLFEPTDLHEGLRPYVFDVVMGNGSSMQVLKHPLIFSVPYYEAENKLWNQRYEARRQRAEAFLAAGEYERYISLHERPFRPERLLEVADHLSDEAYWSTLGSLWQDTENAWQLEPVWEALWTAQQTVPSGCLMTEAEQTMLRSLPDVVKIYRGFNGEGAKDGLSWTLDLEKAKWFARRWLQGDEAGVVAVGNVERAYIRALFLGRNESEVVVDPGFVNVQALKKVRKVKTRQ